MAAGLFYWLVPRLFGTRLWSTRMADLHFWLGMAGILLYVGSMWVSGVTQGLMSRAETADGGLQYPYWSEVLQEILPMYAFRAVGGGLFILGWLLMTWNLVATALSGRAVNGEAEVAVLREPAAGKVPSTARLVWSQPL